MLGMCFHMKICVQMKRPRCSAARVQAQNRCLLHKQCWGHQEHGQPGRGPPPAPVVLDGITSANAGLSWFASAGSRQLLVDREGSDGSRQFGSQPDVDAVAGCASLRPSTTP